MRLFDFALLMGFVAILYWLTQKGRQRKVRTEELDFTPLHPINVTSSDYFNFPKATENALPYYIVIDTETADIIAPPQAIFLEGAAEIQFEVPPYPPIVRLSWTLLDHKGDIIKEESYTLKRHCPITPSAEAIHGISNQEMNTFGIAPHLVYKAFFEDLNSIKVIVAHNLVFHKEAIRQDLQNLKLDLPSCWSEIDDFCTMEEGKKFLERQHKTEVNYSKLSSLYGMLYFQRSNLTMTFDDKSRRDRLLVTACLRYFLNDAKESSC